MKPLREMTEPGDPMMRIRLPKALKEAIKSSAKKNRRQPQDEVIKRITATRKHGEALEIIQGQLIPELSKIYQR